MRKLKFISYHAGTARTNSFLCVEQFPLVMEYELIKYYLKSLDNKHFDWDLKTTLMAIFHFLTRRPTDRHI